jgi:hypothetical protein
VARKIDQVTTPPSPRDQFITIYGRIPVLEALRKHNLDVAKIIIIIADDAHGRAIDQIVDEAHRRDIEIQHTSPARIKRLAGVDRNREAVDLSDGAGAACGARVRRRNPGIDDPSRRTAAHTHAQPCRVTERCRGRVNRRFRDQPSARLMIGAQPGRCGRPLHHRRVTDPHSPPRLRVDRTRGRQALLTGSFLHPQLHVHRPRPEHVH